LNSFEMAKPASRRLPSASSKQKLPSPPPFEPAPTNLEPFLTTLSKSSVYITHIDRHTPGFKRQIFAVPVLLNLTFLILLTWRAYAIVPFYFRMLVSTLGYEQNDTTIHANAMSSSRMAWLIAQRAFTFLIDYVLVTIIWKWPISFFFEGPHNPVSWRWKIGFRKEEILVRISRTWDGADLVSGNKKGGESPFFRTRILPALDAELMLKTGYVMMNADWDLDFGVMVEAAKLVDKKTLDLEDLDRRVLVWQPLGTTDGQWLMWDEKNYGKEKTAEIARPTEPEPAGTAEGRQKIMQIQDRLRSMGKEALFYKWVELIQYESTRPGGFSKERQAEAGAKVQALFEEHGVDFEEFEKSVGGI
jgi:hypothetical protein